MLYGWFVETVQDSLRAAAVLLHDPEITMTDTGPSERKWPLKLDPFTLQI